MSARVTFWTPDGEVSIAVDGAQAEALGEVGYAAPDPMSLSVTISRGREGKDRAASLARLANPLLGVEWPEEFIVPEHVQPQRDPLTGLADTTTEAIQDLTAAAWDILAIVDEAQCPATIRRLRNALHRVAPPPTEAQRAAIPRNLPLDLNRCAVCAWPLKDRREDGCVRGDCSMRPRPERMYDAARAEAEGKE
jgi:hypothetical protein